MIKYKSGDTIILKTPINQEYDMQTINMFFNNLIKVLPEDVTAIILPVDFDLEVLREQDNNIKTVYGNERDM